MTPETTTATTPSLVGQTIDGRLRVEARIPRDGTDGGGEADAPFAVYRSEHTELQQSVALKLLPEGGGTSFRRSQFDQEATAISRLDHPNIASVLDWGVWAGRPYLATEWLEGETLADRLRRGPLPFEEAQAIMRQLLAALSAAHVVGLAHRNLKPSNVFLQRRQHGPDRVKLLDFGLLPAQTRPGPRASVPHTPEGERDENGARAKFGVEDSSSARAKPAADSQNAVGSQNAASFVAPELRAGETPDARTDVFAAGAILSAMLAAPSASSSSGVIASTHPAATTLPTDAASGGPLAATATDPLESKSAARRRKPSDSLRDDTRARKRKASYPASGQRTATWTPAESMVSVLERSSSLLGSDRGAALQAVIDRARSQQPSERYASAAQMLAELIDRLPRDFRTPPSERTGAATTTPTPAPHAPVPAAPAATSAQDESAPAVRTMPPPLPAASRSSSALPASTPPPPLPATPPDAATTLIGSADLDGSATPPVPLEEPKTLFGLGPNISLPPSPPTSAHASGLPGGHRLQQPRSKRSWLGVEAFTAVGLILLGGASVMAVLAWRGTASQRAPVAVAPVQPATQPAPAAPTVAANAPSEVATAQPEDDTAAQPSAATEPAAIAEARATPEPSAAPEPRAAEPPAAPKAEPATETSLSAAREPATAAPTPSTPPPAPPKASGSSAQSVAASLPVPFRSQRAPDARNPWGEPLPEELADVPDALANGGHGDEDLLRKLRAFNRANPQEGRGNILLGTLYLNRFWRNDGVYQYAIAIRRDAALRGAPEILPKLLTLVAQGKEVAEVGPLIEKAYGNEALDLIDKRLSEVTNSVEATNLQALATRITSPDKSQPEPNSRAAKALPPTAH